MRKLPLVLIITVIVTALTTASAAPLYVIADELNGRSSASLDASVESHFYFGEELDVVSYSGDWVEVKGGETGTVFVFADYTSDIQPVKATHTAFKVASKAKVNVRSTPNGNAVKRLENGKKVDVSYYVGEWARIPAGWVKVKYLEAIENE